MILSLLHDYWFAFVQGAALTLLCAATVSAFGLFAGVPLGWFAADGNRLMVAVVGLGRWFLGVVPPLIVIIWFYYPLQRLLGLNVSPYWTCVAALSLVNILLIGQIVYDGRKRVPSDLKSISKMYGISLKQSIFRVEGPFVLRTAMPVILSSQVMILHSTLLGSFIGVEESLKTAAQINAIVYRPIEIFTILALIFALICMPLTVAASRLSASLWSSERH